MSSPLLCWYSSLAVLIHKKYPAITLLAYLDDVFAVGEPALVLSFLEEFKLSFKSIGLQIK